VIRRTTAIAAGALTIALVVAIGERAVTQSVFSPLPQSIVVPGGKLDPEEVELGRLLFWDPILSGDRDSRVFDLPPS